MFYYLGDVKYKPHIICEPEIRTLVLDGNEEFLVLCSDGLWGHTTPEDVEEIIYDELLEMNGEWIYYCMYIYKIRAIFHTLNAMLM